MSKSQWLTDDKQTGNFSNEGQDTFDPGKGYVGIRLQQGVPLLDRDWNELEDIRRYAEVMLRKHYIGDGTPDDGFKISALDEPGNDFKISIGRCLVDGFEVVNAPVVENGDEIEYILYSQQEDFVPLNGTTNDPRTDIVYLDVWIEEIKAAEEEEEDPLKNPQDVKMETCIRHRLEWRVRVKEGNTVNPGEEKHYYYNIAQINRPADNDKITGGMIEDLRKTNLAVYQLKGIIDSLTINVDEHNHSKLVSPGGTPDPALMVNNNGNVGIGTNDPQEKLHINGSVRGNLLGGALNIKTEHGNVEIGPQNGGWAHFKTDVEKFYFNKEICVDTGCIRSYNESLQLRTVVNNNVITRMIILKDTGNVGIGTNTPKNKLDVEGGAVIGSNYSGTDTAPQNGLLVQGNVGIGTTSPVAKLQIVGGTDVKPTEGGYLVIGETGGENIAIDDNEIMVRKAGTTSPLHLQAEGGGLFVNYKLEGKQFLVKSDGKVGIGTDDPKDKLDVHGALVFDGNVNTRVYGDKRGSNRDTVVMKGYWDELEVKGRVIDWTGNNFHIGFENDHKDHYIEIGKYVGNIRFLSGGGIVETMRITDGKVGIGTDEPDFKLHIKSDGTVGHFESTADTAVLRLITSEGIENRVCFINRPGGRATIFVPGGLDAFNVLKNGNVGIGTVTPGNDKLDVRGRCYSSGGWHITNGDYAEYFESDDSSNIPEGTSVTFTKKGKIKPAKKGENPIGILSTNSAILGNSYKEWPKKYLKDEFGNQIMEEYKEEIMIPKKEKIKKERQKTKKKKIKEKVKRTEIVQKKGRYCQVEIEETIEHEKEEPVFKEVDLYDASGKKKIGKHQVPVMETYEEEIDVKDEKGQPVMVGSGKFETKTRPKINPEYDETKEYIPREKRPEWNCVGLLGQLPLRKGQPVAPTWVKIKDISKDVELWLVK